MSQNWQPPQQPQQPGGYGYPQQPGGYPQQPGGYPPPAAPYGAGPQFGGGFPPPVPARRGNPLQAALAGLAVAILGAVVYAFMLSALADTDINMTNPNDGPSVTHIAYAFVVLGALVGATIGRLGGRNPSLWVLGAVFALVAAFFGELYGYAMILHDVMSNAADKMGGAGGAQGNVLSASDIFFDHFGDLWDAWKEDADAISYIFIALAPVSAASVAYRASNGR